MRTMGQDNGEVSDLLERAHVLRRQFGYTEALPLIEQAVEVAPQSVAAWRELGAAYGYLGRTADMEQAFEQALRLAAALDVASGEEAEDGADREMELAMTWFARGNAENNSGAYQRALHSFTMFAELEPDWGVPWLYHGMVLGNMGVFVDSRSHEQALAALDRALELGLSGVTDERIAYDLKSESLATLGRPEEAQGV